MFSLLFTGLSIPSIPIWSCLGFWATTAASYCPSRPWELSKLMSTEYRNRGDGSLCMYFMRQIWMNEADEGGKQKEEVSPSSLALSMTWQPIDWLVKKPWNTNDGVERRYLSHEGDFYSGIFFCMSEQCRLNATGVRSSDVHEVGYKT